MKFIVEVPVVATTQLIIEATTSEEARALAAVFATSIPPAPPLSVEVMDIKVLAGAPAPDVPAVNQTCTHCGCSRLKAAWGPGQMFCPACGKTPLAACEAR